MDGHLIDFCEFKFSQSSSPYRIYSFCRPILIKGPFE